MKIPVLAYAPLAGPGANLLTIFDIAQVLLEVVHELFEEQTSVENVVMKIMQRAQSLLRCERCVVMLKDSSDVKMEVNLLFFTQKNGPK